VSDIDPWPAPTPRLRKATTRTDAWGKRRTPAERREWRRMQWRWRLADLLNRSKRTCWASIVMWAQRDRKRDENGISTVFDGPQCALEGETHRDSTCYCGKFRDRVRWP
jgi:hypothetical protein